MVLNRTDFGKCWKSSQILTNVAFPLKNRILTVLELAGKHFG